MVIYRFNSRMMILILPNFLINHRILYYVKDILRMELFNNIGPKDTKIIMMPQYLVRTIKVQNVYILILLNIDI